MKTKTGERPISVLVGPELLGVLRERAAMNHRALTREVVFLIETALAVSSESVRETIHLLYKANVEVTPEDTPLPASLAP